MRTFLIKIFCFGVGFLVFDKILIPVRNHSPKLEVDKRLEQIVVGQIDADILIFGSSRGARSVVAYQIEESLNRSCYNLSYPGSHIVFHEYLLREVLGHRKNTKPSTIVLVVDDADVFKEAVSLDFRLDRLFPLVKYPSIRSELVRRGQKKWGFNEILVSHQINRSFLFMEQKQFSERDFILPCGSMLLDHQKPGLDFQYDDTPNSYSTDGELTPKVAAFDGFVSLCRENQLDLVVAITPNFRPATDGFKERLERQLNGYGTVFEFDSSVPEYRDHHYYYDYNHLQKNGAHLYTGELIDEIRSGSR